MTNNDIEYMTGILNPAFEGIQIAIDQLEGIQMHLDNGDIEVPTIDKAIISSAHSDLINTQAILFAYDVELQARKQ